MKCYKCGAELSDDTRFCSYCGVRIEEQFPEMQSSAENETNIQNQVQEESIGQNEVHNMPTDNSQETSVSPIAKETLGDKIKAKLLAFWKSLDGFSKVITVSIAVVVLLLLIAVCTGKGFAIFFSIIQFSGLIVAILMHKNVIKLEAKKKWIKYIILVTAILLSFLNIMSYSWGKDKKPNYDTTYQTKISDTTSPSDIPVITTAKSPYNTDECVGQNYSTIKSAFATAGFTNIKLEKIEDLKLADADKVNAIESVSIGGKTDFIKEQEFDKDEEILIYYHTYEKCNVKIHIDFIPNLIFSKYDVNLLFDGIEKGTIEHGTDKDFEFTVDPGEYLITFESDESSSVKGEVTLLVDSDTEASYKISCHSDEISVKTIAGTTNGTENESTSSEETNAPKITMTMGEEDFKGMNYKEAEIIFREMGFTAFEYRTVDTDNESDVDNICYIEIKEWLIGDSDFVKGDEFEIDSTVTFFFYTYEVPVPSPVFYSTNDYDIAKNGNTGVFSYIDNGNSYDIYWIIDFDEGYVYYFTDGDGGTWCDKLKIDSGTLNDAITITYHDGSDVWSYKLHFKYANHPEALIMVDQNGFKWEYSTTDLNEALSLKATKTIKEY